MQKRKTYQIVKQNEQYPANRVGYFANVTWDEVQVLRMKLGLVNGYQINSIIGTGEGKLLNPTIEHATAPQMTVAENTDKRPIMSLSVDAWTSGNPGMGGCRLVGEYKGQVKELSTYTSKAPHSNNLFELVAVLIALRWASKEENRMGSEIYSDSKTVLAWITKAMEGNKKILGPKVNERELIENTLLDIKLLMEQTKVKLIKWNTELWGEIPADFNRKK